MFCRNCGTETTEGNFYCEARGYTINETPVQNGHASNTTKMEHDKGSAIPATAAPTSASTAVYRSFEYAHTTVKTDLAQAACDCYESLGYELTSQRKAAPGRQTTLSFRRSRKVRSKAQLSKMQRTMDDTLVSITNLEAEKTRKATIQALVIGIVSTLIFGTGMCCTMVWTHLVLLGIVVGIVGIAGCVLAYFRYRKVCEVEAKRINPQIEEAYDRLATQCEEAQAILRTSE